MKPLTRMENILLGNEVKPLRRKEFFAQEHSGGAGLPPYTLEDKGKVLTIATKTQEVVVIPEQTVTFSGGGAQLSDVNLDFNDLVDGDTIAVTVDGHVNEFIFKNKSGEFVCKESEGRVSFNGSMWFLIYTDGPDGVTASISATMQKDQSATPSWEKSSEGLLIVHEKQKGTDYSLDKTFREILDADTMIWSNGYATGFLVDRDLHERIVRVAAPSYINGDITWSVFEYSASSDNDYPSKKGVN